MKDKKDEVDLMELRHKLPLTVKREGQNVTVVRDGEDEETSENKEE